MTTKELKRLSRMELLQLLLIQTQEVERLKTDNASLKEQLECRTIQVAEAGNIAEASMKINGVMESAQKAAQQYLDNLHHLSETAQHNFHTMEEKTRQKCQEMEAQAKLDCDAMKQETSRICAEMEEATQRKCDELTGKALAQNQNQKKSKSRKKGHR